MEIAQPRFVDRQEVLALRTRGVDQALFTGLWLAGSLEGLRGPTVAIVGPRAPSAGARARAHELGRAMARAGVCVVSGLALGIDGAGHAGALAGGGRTIGVLGGGHRRFFPERNRALAEAMIAAGGAVVSPFGPDEPALPFQFLQRNGIVAAFADAVVIVEAAARSGALNTASWAGNLGVEVLAFPGDVDRPKAAGCNALIRDGATLVRGPEDVLAALDRRDVMPLGLGGLTTPHETYEPVDPLERRVFEALSNGPAAFDELAGIAPSIPALAAALVQLELEGAIERSDGCLYALRRPPLVGGNRRAT
jgi:DNA processing protein